MQRPEAGKKRIDYQAAFHQESKVIFQEASCSQGLVGVCRKHPQLLGGAKKKSSQIFLVFTCDAQFFNKERKWREPSQVGDFLTSSKVLLYKRFSSGIKP